MVRAFPLVLLCLLHVHAQTSPTGTIQGVVLDPSGAPAANVSVQARNVESGAARTAETGENGQFSMVGLPIGTYTLRAERAGFAPVNVAPFLVSVGQIVVQRITLPLAGVETKVEVTEKSDVVEAAASASSVALGYDRIEEAPAPNRSYLNFVSLAPGVSASSGSSTARVASAPRSPMADSGFSFAGLSGRNNSISIDGVDNRDEFTGGNRVAVGLEMIQEFRVSGVSVGAELGGAAGGLVNVVTRSGVNLWHGDWTFFAQNEGLNARGPEAEGTVKPRGRRYQPGVSTSGPIRRDRTFFSAAVEYERESGEERSETPEEAAAIIGPRVSRGLFPNEDRGAEASFKLNHQLGARDGFVLRYAFSRGRVAGDMQGSENFQDRSVLGRSTTTDHSLAGNWVSVLSPTRVNEFRVQVAQRSQTVRPNTDGPMFEIPGVVSFGQSYRLNGDRTENHYQAVENFSFVLGRHRLSAGADVHGVTLDSRIANRFGGIFIFPTLADFARGTPDVFLQAFGDARTRLNTVPVGLWIQERWQLNPELLLEAGVRYDRQRMPAGLPPSSNNFSPRLGLAWRPWPKTPLVFRAGFGLFSDRYPLAYLNQAAQNSFEQYATGADAVRALQSSKPVAGIAHHVYRASDRFPSTYSRKFSAGAERGFGQNTTLTVEASAVSGFHLPRIRHYLLEQTARSEYRGALIALNRRMSRELTFLFSYAAGQAKDDASDFDEQPSDPDNLRQDWSRSRQHQLHRLGLSAVFECPGMESITLAPVFTAGSGRPINALLTADYTGAYPISARPEGMPRNPYFGPATVSMDLRAMKTIRVKHERMWVQFGVESFNLLNHSNAVRVSPYYAAGRDRLPSYGGLIEAQNGRQMQLFMQIEY
ncbi:MAG: TonB-dependent receptor domain-containing protein [Bryobacteraceae bacterium]